MKNDYQIKRRMKNRIKVTILSVIVFVPFLGFAQSPGGVSTNLVRWYKANAGITTGATMTWSCQATANTVTQSTAANQPTYNTASGLINFNPCFTFDGTNDRLSSTTSGFAHGTNDYTYYYVAINSGPSASNWVIGTGANASLNGFNSGSAGTATTKQSGGTTFVSQTTKWADGIPNITRTGYNGGVTQPYYQSTDGGTDATSTNVSPNISATNFSIGARPGGDANWWTGKIAEVIGYNTKHISGSNQQLTVESYLAIKYGITLDQTVAKNYLNSSTTTIWDATTNSTYKYDIAGIGRDDNSL
jgi:hypothetical protein